MANSIYTIFIILILILLFFNFNFFELFKNLNNNKDCIIYFTQEEYLPLYLFIQIFEKILINNNYKVTKVKNIDQNIIKNNNFIIFGLELNESIMNFLIDNKIKTIMINTEYYTLWNVMDKINKLHEKIDFYVLDSSTINIIKIKTLIPTLNIIHLPLLYDQYLTDFYNLQIKNKIDYKDKDIDILIYGSINERRSHILNQLSDKYNVVSLYSISINFSELCNYIERSKIILDIHQNEFNKAFDYYRLSFLISNKIFTVYEEPEVNLHIETNIIDYDKYLILTPYDKIVETVNNYLNNWNPSEINLIVKNQYEWFSKNSIFTNKVNNFLLQYL